MGHPLGASQMVPVRQKEEPFWLLWNGAHPAHYKQSVNSRSSLSFWAAGTGGKVGSDNEPSSYWSVSRKWHTYSRKAMGAGDVNTQIRGEGWSPKPEWGVSGPSARRSASWDVNTCSNVIRVLIQSTSLKSQYVPDTVLVTGDARRNVRHSCRPWEISVFWERQWDK